MEVCVGHSQIFSRSSFQNQESSLKLISRKTSLPKKMNCMGKPELMSMHLINNLMRRVRRTTQIEMSTLKAQIFQKIAEMLITHMCQKIKLRLMWIKLQIRFSSKIWTHQMKLTAQTRIRQNSKERLRKASLPK